MLRGKPRQTISMGSPVPVFFSIAQRGCADRVERAAHEAVSPLARARGVSNAERR